MFPMLAIVKRRSDLSVIYRDLILMTAFGTFAVGIALVVIIPPALRAASLDQWLDIVPLLVWFVAWAGLALNGSINSIVMQALDAPNWTLISMPFVYAELELLHCSFLLPFKLVF